MYFLKNKAHFRKTKEPLEITTFNNISEKTTFIIVILMLPDTHIQN